MYPAYVRGQARLMAKDGVAAASEFKKIIDNPGIAQNFVPGALAHLEQGRAYAMQGETAKARTAYQDFLTLWKDARPGHSNPEASQSRIRKVAVIPCKIPLPNE